MLFTKPIDKIIFNDVLQFCSQKIKEGSHLDYKEQIPSKLEKTVSAMANTFGGIIVIGVEDDDGVPADDPKGINYDTGLETKITAILTSRIFPPIIPEIKVVHNDKKNKAFIIIRIHQSNLSPHSILNRKLVYFRTGDIADPEEIIDEERRSWLYERRKKSVELRESTLANLEEMSENVEIKFSEEYKEYIANLKKAENNNDSLTAKFPLDPSRSDLLLSISPIFPEGPIIERDKLNSPEFLHETKSKHPHEFPNTDYQFKPSPSGVFSTKYSPQTRDYWYTEINELGFIFHRTDISITPDNQHYTISILDIIGLVLSAIRFAENIYKEIGYFGMLEIKVNINNLLQKKALFRGMSFPISNSEGQWSFEKEVIHFLRPSLEWKREFTINELTDQESGREIVISLVRNIFWDCGRFIPEDAIKDFLRDY